MAPRLRSCLSTPLVAGSQLTGVLALYSTSRDAFSEEHQRVIEVVARQVTPAVQQAAELQKTRSGVVRDRQTGLPKLESFRDLAATQIAEASAHRPVSLVVVEMPDLGHSTDEPYVSHVVRAVRRSLRAADMLFKYQGRDLVALLLQTDRITGLSIGNRISQAMVDTKSDDTLDLTNLAPVSISVVSAPEDGITIDELLHRASIRRVSHDDGRARERKPPPSIH
jgi:diguanylate cyclase (GGDEF)-like protein